MEANGQHLNAKVGKRTDPWVTNLGCSIPHNRVLFLEQMDN